MKPAASIDATAASIATPDLAEDLPLRFDDFIGYGFRDKPILSPQQIATHLDMGLSLPGKVITYSFLDTPTQIGVFNNPHWPFPETDSVSPFTDAQRAVARDTVRLWDDLIPESIVEKKGAGADIVFANTTVAFAGAAETTVWPYQSGQLRAFSSLAKEFNAAAWRSNVFVDPAYWPNQELDLTSNGFGRLAMTHELGHALGLSHPGPYNIDPFNYDNDAAYAQDSNQFTVMSYFFAEETEALVVDPRTGFLSSPQTPMLDDIFTIQAKYGADPTTRPGDTVYGFNTNSGRDVFDFTQNQTPFICIYDAGGNDTLDLSGFNAGVFIDLRPGSFSSAGMIPTLAEANAGTSALNAVTDDATGDFPLWTQPELDQFISFLRGLCAESVAAYTGVAGVQAMAFENISIAYDTIIENAVGSPSRDYIVGNDAANRLDGGAGDDVLNGLGGADTLVGGAGADEFRFTELGAADRIVDFQPGEDFLNLSGIDADASEPGHQSFSLVAAFSRAPGQLTLTWDPVHRVTIVSLDVDGDGHSNMDILLNGHVTDTAGWIL